MLAARREQVTSSRNGIGARANLRREGLWPPPTAIRTQHVTLGAPGGRFRAARQKEPAGAPERVRKRRPPGVLHGEFAKGGLVKGGLAIYVLKTNQIVKPPFTKPPLVNSRLQALRIRKVAVGRRSAGRKIKGRAPLAVREAPGWQHPTPDPKRASSRTTSDHFLWFGS